MSVDVAGGVLQPRGSYSIRVGKEISAPESFPCRKCCGDDMGISLLFCGIHTVYLSIIRACTSIYNVNTINTYTMLRKHGSMCVYVCVEGLHGMRN